eukprot:TRINITY_DN1868_c1_g1_i1.p1 TRINITY_DN1868_c1_g1~~TRINITY_DN1868_c1_g1_i1.p1  ORF type:complete len:807 (+),score=187.11 TRINITY_DN1868_c1_g1_i1:79-2499(+)
MACCTRRSPDDRLDLDVGGVKLSSSRGTVSKSPVLAKLIQGSPGRDGYYYIDRNGKLYDCVIQFLRDGELFVQPTSRDIRAQLRREAEYLGLPKLAEVMEQSLSKQTDSADGDDTEEYIGAPLPSNEEERLRKLAALSLSGEKGTRPPKADHFEHLTNILACLIDVPISLVSLVGKEEQWFLSAVGLEATETPRCTSFCAYHLIPPAVEDARMFVVSDAHKDDRFVRNPLVTGEPFIRFYSGCPLVTSEGLRLGAFCAIDTKPHVPGNTWQQAQIQVNLGQVCTQELERADLQALSSSEMPGSDNGAPNYAGGLLRGQRMKDALEELVLLVQLTDEGHKTPNFRLLYGNRSWCEKTGVSVIPPRTFRDKPVAMGTAEPMGKSNPILWDYLTLENESVQDFEKRLRRQLEEDGGTFGECCVQIKATVKVGGTPVTVSGRAAPAEIPMDITSSVIAPDPIRPRVALGSEPEGNGLPKGCEGRLIFLVMVIDKEREKEQKEQPTMQRQESAVDKSKVRPPPSPFSSIKLTRMIGEGAFGKVYFGVWLGVHVAVKVIHTSNSRGNQVETAFEASLSGTLSHPNLVQTFNHSTRAKQRTPGELENMKAEAELLEYETWIVQEWCDKGTFDNLCRTSAPFETLTLLEIFIEISSAGAYLHSRGILHGDLNGNNILVHSHVCRKGYICKICDFGLARVFDEDKNDVPIDKLGTVTHMPPELFMGSMTFTRKADVYAIGVSLWQAVMGERPFAGLAYQQILFKMASGATLEIRDDAPEDVITAFKACTAHNPDDRWECEQLVSFLLQAKDKLFS